MDNYIFDISLKNGDFPDGKWYKAEITVSEWCNYEDDEGGYWDPVCNYFPYVSEDFLKWYYLGKINLEKILKQYYNQYSYYVFPENGKITEFTITLIEA